MEKRRPYGTGSDKKKPTNKQIIGLYISRWYFIAKKKELNVAHTQFCNKIWSIFD
jgi:GT2 family glycosyltransferase